MDRHNDGEQAARPDIMSDGLPTPLMTASGVTVRFGGIVALDGVALEAYPGEVCSVIGPNGAGKTTFFNCLSRLYQPAAGRIVFDGTDLCDQPRHTIAALGLGRTFQNLALFRTMTVLENVMIGGHCRTRGGFLASALRLPHVAAQESTLRRKALEACAFTGLDAFAGAVVGSLPFGVQKRVEMARALVSEPKMLLLDEPAAGLNHEEVAHLQSLIRDVCERLGVAVLLVEHHMNLVMAVSDRVVVLNFGRKIAAGRPDEVRRDPEVIRAYLGDA